MQGELVPAIRSVRLRAPPHPPPKLPRGKCLSLIVGAAQGGSPGGESTREGARGDASPQPRDRVKRRGGFSGEPSTGAQMCGILAPPFPPLHS